MKHLWAPWRMSYIGAANPPAGCVFCNAVAGTDDRHHLVLLRRAEAFLILNLYPYAAGHVMAVLNRHVGALTEVTPSEMLDLMQLVSISVTAIAAEYRAEGFNVGINQGRVAGAGILDHLHVHVVPRWNGDNNFMSVVGDARVIPESPETTYDRLKGRFVG